MSGTASRIVLGLGGTVDHEVHWDPAALQRLVDAHGIGAAELFEPPAPVARDEREIVLTLLRAMGRGLGWECYVADPAALGAFDARLAHTTTLGGTCVRAALAMERLGVPSTVHLVAMSREVRELLPESVEWVCSADEESCDPHVIVQYPSGAVLTVEGGAVVAPRPNRVILVNDAPNERLLLSRELPGLVARARVVLVSGFNTMKSAALLRRRLEELARALAGAAEGAVVVYEDAGFHDPSMRALVRERAAGLIDLHSLNEDEARDYLGRSVDLGSAAEVADMMRELLDLLGAPAVMVHTSRYAAVIGRRAERLREAAGAGCLLAATRFLHGDAFGPAEHAAVARRPHDEVGARLARDPVTARAGVLIAPGYAVPTGRPTTIGLGDAFIGGVVAHLARD